MPRRGGFGARPVFYFLGCAVVHVKRAFASDYLLDAGRAIGYLAHQGATVLSHEGEFVMSEVLLFGFSIGCVPMAFLVLVTLLVSKRLRE